MLDAAMENEIIQDTALEVTNLDIAYRVRGQDRQVIRDLSFVIRKGETFGLVGESGCGKSTVALAVIRYLTANGRIRSGNIRIAGKDILKMDADALRRLRARHVSMVYQEPGKSLNPSLKIGQQVAEVFEIIGVKKPDRMARAEAILKRVHIVDVQRVMGCYPHQLSGGMLQRVVIAMALAVDPTLLILDEPTTALDATMETEVLDLIDDLRREFNSSVLFIGHNLAVISRMCHRVGVLYAGTLVEEGKTKDIFSAPNHPYTIGLLRCLPQLGLSKKDKRLDTIPGFLPARLDFHKGCVFAARCAIAQDLCHTTEPVLAPTGAGRVSRCHFPEQILSISSVNTLPLSAKELQARSDRPVLSAKNLSKNFGSKDHPHHVVRDISFQIMAGETLGLVGESGSGKTTIARMLLGMIEPDAESQILLDGEPLAPLVGKRNKVELEALQIVFQNPDAALNRSQTIRHIISRPMQKFCGYKGAKLKEKLLLLAGQLRLTERYLPMKPRQLSGGLKQRIAIARAFAGEPRVVVCDEPTSALDVSVQAAILNLLADMQEDRQVSYLFISHDLRVIRYISDQIAVLYLGRMMEIGPAEDVFKGPHHPYTESLIAATMADSTHSGSKLTGEIPSVAKPSAGCVFHARCLRKIGKICEEKEPGLITYGSGHAIRCHLPLDELGRVDENEV